MDNITHPIARRTLTNLDGLRGLACLAVVVSHAPGFEERVRQLGGALGVGVFFVLSGFLMGYLYVDKHFQKETLKRYAISRFSRIAPIYLLVIIAVAILTAIDTSFQPRIEGWASVTRHLLFLGSTSVYWSIPPEVQFYVFFIVLWASWWYRRTSLLPLVASISVTAIFVYTRNEWPGITLPSKVIFFIAGVLAGSAPRVHWKLNLIRRILLGSVSILMTLLLIQFESKEEFYSSVLSAFLISICIYLLSYDDRFVNLGLSNKYARMIGKSSFSIYLVHMILIPNWATYFEIDLHTYSHAAASLVAISVVASIFISHYVEIPLQVHVKKKLEAYS